ncbi:MAG: MFS transporter [Corynebacterium sp.]|nr:MFS transporter [Corynebacterium sp.]
MLLTQLFFNVGFYLVVPFLATYMSTSIGASAAMIGFVLGLRTFTQQGMFFLGGGLADKFGVKPVLLTGIVIRVIGFLVIAMAHSVAMMIVGVILIGFAAALFSPAADAALAFSGKQVEEQGIMSRTRVFALDTTVGRIGALSGPVLGAIIIPFGFEKACFVAAGIFALLFLGHALIFPAVQTEKKKSILDGYSHVLRNWEFLLFALCYSTGLVAYNMQYLAMPHELVRLGSGGEETVAVFFIFASVYVSLCQYPITVLTRKMSKQLCLAVGFGLQAVAFLFVAVLQSVTIPYLSVIGMLILLHAGQMIAIPIARDCVGHLCGEQHLGTYFGFLNSVGGFAVLIVSAIVGWLFDSFPGASVYPWLFLTLVLFLSAIGMSRRNNYA